MPSGNSCLYQQIWKTQQWCPEDWKRSILIPILKKGSAVLKNVQITGQLHSSPMLVSLCSISCSLGFSVKWTKTYRCPRWVSKRQRKQRSNCQHLLDHRESKENPEKTSTFVSLTMLKPLTVWIITNCGKLLKRWEFQTILPVSWETCMQVKKQLLEPCMEQLTGSGLRKEYDKSAYCHHVYLTYTQSTWWEMPGWMSYKLDSRLPGETSTTSVICRW